MARPKEDVRLDQVWCANANILCPFSLTYHHYEDDPLLPCVQHEALMSISRCMKLLGDMRALCVFLRCSNSGGCSVVESAQFSTIRRCHDSFYKVQCSSLQQPTSITRISFAPVTHIPIPLKMLWHHLCKHNFLQARPSLPFSRSHFFKPTKRTTALLT